MVGNEVEMARLSDEDRSAFVTDQQGWSIDGEILSRTFVLRDFNEAMGFVMRVGLLAEVADHHPDIDIRWNKVTIALSTHSEGALTSKDTDLAKAVEGLL
jgi:4a-hydroxytetrahydrobiopterin dehydratase